MTLTRRRLVLVIFISTFCWFASAYRIPPLVVARSTDKRSRVLFSEVSEDDRSLKILSSESALSRLLSGKLLFDPVTIGYVVATQCLLLNGAVLIGILLSFDALNVAALNFDTSSMRVGATIAALLVVVGLLFDRLPSRFARETYLDTETYVINLLGRDTDVATGFLLSTIISLGAGFTEEVFFRGALFQAVLHSTNGSDFIALIVSSFIFGLAHYPVYGQNALLETFLGGIFCIAYICSDYNLAVPIVAHSIYDNATIFLTWLSARKEIREGVKQIRAQGTLHEWKSSSKLGGPLVSAFPENFFLFKDVFDRTDLNSDGFIDQFELPIALRMLGYSDKRPFGRDLRGASRVFQKFDQNDDKKISFDEFIQCIQEFELFSKFDSGNTY